MTPVEADKLIDRLAEISTVEKEFDHFPDWVEVKDRSSTAIHYVAAVRLRGALGGGVSVRLVTPSTAWETEVYGQLSVAMPGTRSTLRLNPVEWGPQRLHRNSGRAPAPHAFQTLKDRWHPFDLNRSLGIKVFQQAEPGIAVALPRAIATFGDYTSLCAELWKCPDVNRIPPPPWSRSLV